VGTDLMCAETSIFQPDKIREWCGPQTTTELANFVRLIFGGSRTHTILARRHARASLPEKKCLSHYLSFHIDRWFPPSVCVRNQPESHLTKFGEVAIGRATTHAS
jgi:hypothetical protein